MDKLQDERRRPQQPREPLLDDAHSTHLFFRVGENLARAQVPEVAVAPVRSGRMTALSKDDGSVRGIVRGDVVRRLVARTIAQRLGPAVMAATPHPYAIQALCGLHPGATVTSSISRRAMLEGLMQVDGSSATLPFVRMFYGAPSEYCGRADASLVYTQATWSFGDDSPNIACK